MSVDPEVMRLQQASEWVQLLHESPDDEAVLSAWLEWSGADAANLQAFTQIQQIWEHFEPPARSEVELAAAAPAGRAAKWPDGLWKWPAGLAATFLLVTGIVTLREWMPPWSAATFATAPGEHRDEILPDGSRIALAADSKLSIEYSASRRRVWLKRGEAYFSVARDPKRPFVVRAGALRVTAVGTAFDIRSGVADTVVIVKEGAVRIDSTDSAAGMGRTKLAHIDAGQQVRYSAPAHVVSLRQVDPALAGSWRAGTLQFVAEPLEEVVDDVNRYSSRRIQVVDPRLRQLRFTGTVSQTHTEEWLAALEAVFPVDVLDQGADGFLIQPRKGR